MSKKTTEDLEALVRDAHLFIRDIVRGEKYDPLDHLRFASRWLDRAEDCDFIDAHPEGDPFSAFRSK